MKFSLWHLLILMTLLAIAIAFRLENELIVIAINLGLALLVVLPIVLLLSLIPKRFTKTIDFIIVANVDTPQRLTHIRRVIGRRVISAGIIRWVQANLKAKTSPQEKSIELLTQEMAYSPNMPDLYAYRASCRIEIGNYTGAVTDATKCLQLVDSPDVMLIRGTAYLWLDEMEKALDDLANLSFTESDEAPHLVNRGIAHESLGNWAQAKKDYVLANELCPSLHDATLGLARLQSGCPDPEFRDGQKALRNAKRIAMVADWSDWYSLSVVAAAYAEIGDFEKAVEYARRTLKLAPETEKPKRRERLAQYENAQPLRLEFRDLSNKEN